MPGVAGTWLFRPDDRNAVSVVHLTERFMTLLRLAEKLIITLCGIAATLAILETFGLMVPAIGLGISFLMSKMTGGDI